jgi:hypothetical protein
VYTAGFFNLRRRPLVVIGTERHDKPQVLAAEAAHVVFDHVRKRLGLSDYRGYGEVFDFLNKTRRLQEEGRHDLAEEHLSSFRSRDDFIDEIHGMIREAPERSAHHTQGILDRIVREARSYTQGNTDHMVGIMFIRTALKAGLRDPEHIGYFLRSVVRRESGIRHSIMSGEYPNALGSELGFFRDEAKKISQGGYRPKPIQFKKRGKRRRR